mmetsp:Transcript_28088/g.65397  ORF Transcript_28088/g.65397 Transcript_28088/m.65397 type:complete len:171 (+) Transcript_28088:177-689(+)|eukprot:CAMPEP_0180242482 /NCGR_PEP_ID=MMETSP0987-20121128/33234_1 /TAXON_ID=697907 /ORGANISM="non described non described, Strain CCMP2293" /LENGTH=170 /DNA_ID=CAMNT_0022209573 /DNA_START=119 /DNA_END=631 /DNA_ORIENTATION=+
MSQQRCHYDVLGVDRATAHDAVKSAFRALAKASHPDVVPEDERARAETRFKEIAAAYEVLGDHSKRRDYDREGLRGATERPDDPFSGARYRSTNGGAGAYAWRRDGASASARRGVPLRTHGLYAAAVAVPVVILGLTISGAADFLWGAKNSNTRIKHVEEDRAKRMARGK